MEQDDIYGQWISRIGGARCNDYSINRLIELVEQMYDIWSMDLLKYMEQDVMIECSMVSRIGGTRCLVSGQWDTGLGEKMYAHLGTVGQDM